MIVLHTIFILFSSFWEVLDLWWSPGGHRSFPVTQYHLTQPFALHSTPGHSDFAMPFPFQDLKLKFYSDCLKWNNIIFDGVIKARPTNWLIEFIKYGVDLMVRLSWVYNKHAMFKMIYKICKYIRTDLYMVKKNIYCKNTGNINRHTFTNILDKTLKKFRKHEIH